jgi:1-acyl-sn-glycerol-3-phosphate acyltransferase
MEAEREPSIEREVMDLAARAGAGARPHSPDVTLSDLGLDSLACAELALAVEERFGVRLADSEIEEFRTLADVVAAVEGEQRGGPVLPKGLGRSVGAAKAIAGPAIRWWYRMRIEGTQHVPATGPVIVAPNHRSMWDTPMLVIATPRRLVFMAKIELYRNALLRRLWFELGGFPVRREIADLRAIDTSLAVLKESKALGIYPEGTRSFIGEMLPFLHGAAWFALKTGAPIVPVGIVGTGKRTRGDQPRSRFRHPVTVRFGEPILVQAEPDPEVRREKVEAVTGQLVEAITSLVQA